MSGIELIKEQISLDLDDGILPKVCLNIVKYIQDTKLTQLEHITYNTLFQVSQSRSEKELLLAINYLTGGKAHVLDAAYELFYGGFPLQIEKSYLKQAMDEGTFAHPDTGEEIENYQSLIQVYFKPSQKIKMILGN